MISIEKMDNEKLNRFLGVFDEEMSLYSCELPVNLRPYAEILEKDLSKRNAMEKARDDVNKYFGRKTPFSNGFRTVNFTLGDFYSRDVGKGTLKFVIESSERPSEEEVINKVDKRLTEVSGSDKKYVKRSWGNDGTLDIECLMELHHGYR